MASSISTSPAYAGSVGTSLSGRPGRPSLSADGSHSPLLSLRVPQSVRDALDTTAAEQGRNVSDIVRDALDDYLASEGSVSG